MLVVMTPQATPQQVEDVVKRIQELGFTPHVIPGTLSFGSAVMEEMVVELVRSAGHFAAVVIVNGHGGNTAALAAAGERLAAGDGDPW